jgi:hypothetical protein
MVKGKMDLADPDRDHARLIFLLTCREHHPNEIPKVTGRQILKRLLKTVQAHPGGQTAQALKKLIEHSRYLPWASDVREVLRDKVVRDDAGNAGSDPEPAASLPPIELPKFADMDELKAHFGNLLEPRLYDQAHSDYLEGRAKLSYAIEAVPRGDGRRREIRRLLRATGVKFEEDEDDELFADNELDCYVMSADHYRLLHELRGAFRPLVMGQPGAVAKLESLAHQIEKRPAPSAKWLSDARAVWDMLPQEAWLDHVRRGLERPAAAAPAALSAVPLLAGRHLADALSRSSADAHPCAQAGLVDRPTGWNKCCGDARRDGRVVARPRRPSVSTEGATVRLWHPMGADVAAVEAWRDRLEALQLTQPFAQVWREVYALTDAERDTATYTTRWAAHILKQHQAMTLARINGWRPTLRMWVDAPNDEPWHLVIPAHNLVADYWVQGAGGDDPQTLDSGAYVYVSTDRVQFHRIPEGATDSATGPRRGDPVPLIEIPPVIYSEIMRHADLFTAVASIAADPNWLDQGGNAEHPSQWGRHADDYWRETNTGTLVESGKRRRAMLERIVPRLRIADKLKLEDRYLVVQGTRHEYEIHLGSGACSRSGRHICIVPKSFAEGDKIWLPFEGDRTLSIILSKALLLAADDEITDPVILGQL